MLLFVSVATVALMALFFAWGYAAARARGRSGLGWGLLAAFTGFIGIAILYGLGRPGRPDRPPRDGIVAVSDLPAGGPVRLGHGEPIESDEDRRWQYLCRYHPAVREAVAGLAPFGARAVAELKAAHGAIGDIALVPEIARQIRAMIEAGGMELQPDHAGEAIRLPYERQLAAPLEPGPGDTTDGSTSDGPARSAARQRRSEGSGRRGETPDRPDRRREREPARLETVDARLAVPDSGSPDLNGEETLDIGTLIADRRPGGSVNGARAGGTTPGDADELVHELPMGNAGREAAAAGETAATSESEAIVPGPVTEADLESAVYLETYRDVHLFQTVTGRIFIDRIGLVDSLPAARLLVERTAGGN